LLYFQLAWRNLWRNRKRTLISVSSVFLAVFLALLTRSMQLGSYTFMIQNVVRLSTGYLQIHEKGYWEKRSIDLAFQDEPTLRARLLALDHVTQVIPRLQTFLLAASAHATRGALLQGINPREEETMNGLSKKLISGSYLDGEGQGALLAEGLAKYLGLDVGDTLVLYGMGYHGTTAAGQFRVQGIVHFSLPEINSSFVYLNLPEAQSLLVMPGMVNSLSVMLDGPRSEDRALSSVRGMFGAQYEVMTWQQMMPELVQGIAVDNAGGIIMLAILYLVVGFGIFGTVMMMTLERRREFGVLLAIGMKRARLALTSLTEAVLLSLIGVGAGILAAFPFMAYFTADPIHLSGGAAEAMRQLGLEPLLPLSVQPSIFLSQTIAVLVMALISSIYPLLVLRQMEPVQAMRS
jgi:ABC-type lipoprotein release transport system permease subunit